MIKKILLASMLAASLGSFAVPSVAATNIIFQTAPPQPRAERVPAPRRGYVWVPGHWDAKGQRHQWVKGTWMRERAGYRYSQPKWVERNGRWQLERGNWQRGARDRDGDGVPNRVDSRPNNPNRN